MHFLKYMLVVLILMISAVCFAGPVDINTADVQTLTSVLKGVGPAKAQAIVKYRNEHGPFKTTDDLVLVKGIGDKILQHNKENLSVGKKMQ